MRAVIGVWVVGLALAIAVPVRADCICESHILPSALSEPLNNWPSGSRGGTATEAVIQLAGADASTEAFLPGFPGAPGGTAQTSLTSGEMTLSLSNAGPGLVLATLSDLNATAAPVATVFCGVKETVWSKSPHFGGKLMFDFNTNTISGTILLEVTGGIKQEHIDVEVTGTFDPDAAPGTDAISTIGGYARPLFLPTPCIIPTTNPIGGAALGATFVGLALVALRRRLV